ncbi:hypothetical protein [Saccharothrix stipae]
MDTADLHRIRSAGLYLARHGVLVTWSARTLAGALLGDNNHGRIDHARREFIEVHPRHPQRGRRVPDRVEASRVRTREGPGSVGGQVRAELGEFRHVLVDALVAIDQLQVVLRNAGRRSGRTAGGRCRAGRAVVHACGLRMADSGMCEPLDALGGASGGKPVPLMVCWRARLRSLKSVGEDTFDSRQVACRTAGPQHTQPENDDLADPGELRRLLSELSGGALRLPSVELV